MWKKYILIPLVILAIRNFILYCQDPSQALEKVKIRLENIGKVSNSKPSKKEENLVIAAVACGRSQQRLGELSVMIKSAVIFTQNIKLKFLIFTDSLGPDIEKLLSELKKFKDLTWDIRPPLYPPLNPNQEKIKSEFAPCATQRLFFPQILPEYQNVLYVDTDIVFLQNPLDIWKKLDNMGQKSFGLVTENDDAL